MYLRQDDGPMLCYCNEPLELRNWENAWLIFTLCQLKFIFLQSLVYEFRIVWECFLFYERFTHSFSIHSSTLLIKKFTPSQFKSNLDKKFPISHFGKMKRSRGWQQKGAFILEETARVVEVQLWHSQQMAHWSPSGCAGRLRADSSRAGMHSLKLACSASDLNSADRHSKALADLSTRILSWLSCALVAATSSHWSRLVSPNPSCSGAEKMEMAEVMIWPAGVAGESNLSANIAAQSPRHEYLPLVHTAHADGGTSVISEADRSGDVSSLADSVAEMNSVLVRRKPKRTRRMRCGKCAGCQCHESCGVCRFCTTPSLKKICERRRCHDLQLRSQVCCCFNAWIAARNTVCCCVCVCLCVPFSLDTRILSIQHANTPLSRSAAFGNVEKVSIFVRTPLVSGDDRVRVKSLKSRVASHLRCSELRALIETRSVPRPTSFPPSVHFGSNGHYAK